MRVTGQVNHFHRELPVPVLLLSPTQQRRLKKLPRCWTHSGTNAAIRIAQRLRLLRMGSARIPGGRVGCSAAWNDSERRSTAPGECADRVRPCTAPQASRLNGLRAHFRHTPQPWRASLNANDRARRAFAVAACHKQMRTRGSSGRIGDLPWHAVCQALLGN